MYLIIDTISKQSLVALGEEGKLVDKIVWSSDFKQSEELLVKVDELLTENEVKRKDLTGVVVVNGPGSYTGIRVGVATGNALGFALGVPVVGVSYLDVLAKYAVVVIGDGQVEGLSFGRNKIVALISSIADKYYYGIYKKRGGEVKLIGDYGNAKLEEILRQKRGVNYLVGELSGDDKEELSSDMVFVKAGYSTEGVVAKLVDLSAKELAGVKEQNLSEPLYINQPNITLPNKK